MKKEKYYVYEKAPFLFWIPVCLVIASIMVILINNNIAPANITLQKVFLVTYFTIAYTTSMATLCLTGAFIFCLLDEYHKNKIHNRNLKKAERLSNQFKEVFLKDDRKFRFTKFKDYTPVHCFAKIDENGNLIYTIKAELEIHTDNYDNFFEFFDIPEEQ